MTAEPRAEKLESPGPSTWNCADETPEPESAELDETVILTLSDVPSYVDVGRSSALLVIRDDEQSVQFAQTNYTTPEASNVVVTIVRSGSLNSELTVSYYTVSGTAT